MSAKRQANTQTAANDSWFPLVANVAITVLIWLKTPTIRTDVEKAYADFEGSDLTARDIKLSRNDLKSGGFKLIDICVS